MSVVLKNNYSAILAKIEEGAEEGLKKSADKMKFEIIGELYKTKTGRIYAGHQASAPGQSPASDTKALEDSIEIESEAKLRTAIAPTVKLYPLVLEFGGARMAPRPVWIPVGERLGGDKGPVIEIILAEINKRLK